MPYLQLHDTILLEVLLYLQIIFQILTYHKQTLGILWSWAEYWQSRITNIITHTEGNASIKKSVRKGTVYFTVPFMFLTAIQWAPG